MKVHAHTTHTVRLLKILVNWTFPSPFLQMANVSMWCLSEDPLNRPEMRDTMPALCQIHLASIEWEASLGGDGEVFSGVSYGRWTKRHGFGLHTPFQFYLKENDGSCAAVCEFICWFLVRFWRVAFCSSHLLASLVSTRQHIYAVLPGFISYNNLLGRCMKTRGKSPIVPMTNYCKLVLLNAKTTYFSCCCPPVMSVPKLRLHLEVVMKIARFKRFRV